MRNKRKLIDVLNRAALVSKEDVETIAKSFEEKKLPKNNYFLRSGEKCSKIGFLANGIMCSYIIDEHGEEIVKHFIEAGQFFTDLESFEKGVPADLNIIAIVDSDVLFITKSENKKLLKKNQRWQILLKSYTSEALMKMIQMQSFLRLGSSAERYRYFLKNHSKLALHVPLKYIASYLGLTQSSLSRIRRDL